MAEAAMHALGAFDRQGFAGAFADPVAFESGD
jgi:hypothetical protein